MPVCTCISFVHKWSYFLSAAIQRGVHERPVFKVQYSDLLSGYMMYVTLYTFYIEIVDRTKVTFRQTYPYENIKIPRRYR
jgi:hypothetical protein